MIQMLTIQEWMLIEKALQATIDTKHYEHTLLSTTVFQAVLVKVKTLRQMQETAESRQ